MPCDDNLYINDLSKISRHKMKAGKLLQTLGPGLLWAGAAIGVSHLVQSTRAGANYGFELIWILLLANILKYPFFEFAPRYASVTGKSLIDGYHKLGKGYLVLYVILTFATMFPLQSAITVVTSGLIAQVFNTNLSISILAVLLLVCSAVILTIGKYSLLDKFIKIIILLLSISTIIAVISAFTNTNISEQNFTSKLQWNYTDIAFLIAFVGWMPSAIDISVWHSLWTVAKRESSGIKPKLKDSLLDFNIGYIGTVFFALCFLSLGALVMFSSGEKFSGQSVAFAGQLIELYTCNIGSWAYYLIAIAALATMFSTTITCLDAYPRVLTPVTHIFFPVLMKKHSKSVSLFWMIFLIAGTLIVILFFTSGLKFLVDLATTLSFLTAPILGFLNYKVVTNKEIPKEMQPKLWLKILSWVGLIFLTGLGIYFIIIKFF